MSGFTYTNGKGKTYHLHSRSGRGNGQGKLFFFAGEPKEGIMDQLPDGYEVSETERGLPVLKKIKPTEASEIKATNENEAA